MIPGTIYCTKYQGHSCSCKTFTVLVYSREYLIDFDFDFEWKVEGGKPVSAVLSSSATTKPATRQATRDKKKGNHRDKARSEKRRQSRARRRLAKGAVPIYRAAGREPLWYMNSCNTFQVNLYQVILKLPSASNMAASLPYSYTLLQPPVASHITRPDNTRCA